MVEEVVQALDDFGCGLRSAVGIFFQEEVAGQPVGVDPGVPVVHPAVGKAHPGEVAFEAGVEDAAIDFVVDALGDEGGHFVQFGTEKISRPGEQGAGFGGEEVNGGFFNIRQTLACFLNIDMGGNPQ